MIKKIFIVHHTHTDIGYTDIQTEIFNDHVDFLDKVLDCCKETDNYPEDAKFRWTCEVSWTVKNYFEKRPARISEFIKRVKEGRIEITGLYLNLTELYTAEELIRSLYFAKGIEKRYGIKIVSAMNSDVPGLSWIIPQILAKSGIKYLSMSTDPIRSFRPEVPYPFYWLSPDGSKVLTWNTESKGPNSWYGIGYGLGFGDSYKTVSEKLPDYLRHLEDEEYPYEACCIRTGMDNWGPRLELSRIAKEWNERHKFPKIIVSTNKEFFEYMEKKYKDKIPSYKLAWPDWWADGNASAAYEAGLSRDTHRELITIEKLGSILSLLGENYSAEKIKKVWDDISFFDEHTWGASGSIEKPYSLQTKAQWTIKSSFVYQAAIESERLINKNLNSFAAKIKNPGELKLVIFNPLSYRRDGIVSFKQNEISFLAKDIPPLGYKTYKIPSVDKKADKYFVFNRNSIENEFYKVILDPTTGGIKSLYDKGIKKELVEQKNPYKFNQYIYEEIVSGGRRAIYDETISCPGPKKRGAKFRRTSPESCRIKKGKDGPVTGSIIVETKAKGCPKIIQKIILYRGLKRIDIVNTLFKRETLNPEAIYYAFPFNFKNPEIKFEIAGAVMNPEIDQLPGTAKDYYSIQDWVSISDKNYGIIWVTKEAPLVQFGEINTGKWITDKSRIKNGVIFSWIMNNYWYTNFKASQGGEIIFRYSITSYKGKIDNSKISLFAQECNNSLIALPIKQNPKGILPKKGCSFLSLDKKNVCLLALKKSEDGKGIIIRLQKISGKDTLLTLTFPYFSSFKVYLSTITEEEIKPLPINKNKLEVFIGKFEIVTIKVIKGFEGNWKRRK